MNKIEALIEKFCPDGVEYKEIGEVLDYEQPTKYIVSTAKYHESYRTPVLTAGQTFILGYTDESTGIYEATKESPVIIFDDFTTSFHWVDFNFKVKSSAMKILSSKKDAGVNFRFVYYSMKCIVYNPQDHARQWISVYSKFTIPIPPLEVQEEIVKTLDLFTTLEAELEAELEARKVQYAYYRDSLLSPTMVNGKWLMNNEEVEWKALGEVCEVQSGGTPSKNKSEYWDKGTIKWLGSTVCKNKKTVEEVTDFITEKGLKNSSTKVFKKEATLIALVGATIGKVAFLPYEAATNQNVAGLYPKNSDELNTSYLYYSCTMLYEVFTNMSQDKLKMANLSFVRGLKIPIPPLLVQERIVSILDKFDALVNGISVGLPAEIEGRRKQYEYYRNRLLTFKGVVSL